MGLGRRGGIVHYSEEMHSNRSGADDLKREEFDQQTDFLLTHTRPTRLQFVGLLVLGVNLILSSTVLWCVYCLPLVRSRRIIDFVAVLVGSAFWALVTRIGHLEIKRAFVGRRR